MWTRLCLNFAQRFTLCQIFCIALDECNAANTVWLSLHPSTVEDKERGEGQKHGRGALKDNILSDKDETERDEKR